MSDKIKLKDVCKILNGFVFKSGKYVDSGIRIIRIANVQKGYIEDEKPAFYPDSEESSIRDYMLEENDLLLSLTGNVGRVALLDKKWLPAALNQRVACFRIKDNRIIKEYLYFALLSDKFENDCIKSSKGIAQKNMSTEWIKGYEIPLPSEQKQREIVSSLEQLSMIIKNKTEQIQQLDNLIKARFVEMFEDNFGEIVELGNVCDVRDGTHDSPKYHNEGYPLVTSKNICNGKIDFSTCNLIQKEDYDKINKRSKVEIGDILMPMIGTVGNPIIINTNNEFAIKNVALIKFKDNSVILNTFVKALLESDYFGRAVLSKTKGGTQKFISLGDIRKLELNLPPIELQNQFAAFVAQVDKSKFTLSNELAMGNFYIRLIHDCIMHGCIDLRVPQ